MTKDVQFKEVVELLGFIDRLVPYFEQKDHHPDVHIYYNRVRFVLSRYDMGQ